MSRTMRACTRIASHRVAGQVLDRPAQQLEVARGRPRLHGGLSPGGGASASVSVHELSIIMPDGAVDRGVVVLREQRPRSALQTLDDVHLPQRPAAVHRPADDACDLLGRAGRPARRGELKVADVEVEIEVGVVDPVRMVEAERHLDDAATDRLELADQPGVLAYTAAYGSKSALGRS